MEKETTRTEETSGLFQERETIRTTPEDGIVPDKVTRPAALSGETRGKAHVGYQSSRSFSTNDPRVTRPVVYIFCGIFLLIALITLINGLWGFSIIFGAAAVFAFIKENKRIDGIAQELSQKGQDVTIDSPEELKEVMTGVADEMKTGFQQSGEEVFTSSNIRRFTKLTLPIFCVLGVAVSLALGFVVGKAMGIFIFVLFAAIGVFYYCVLLKIIEKIFAKKK